MRITKRTLTILTFFFTVLWAELLLAGESKKGMDKIGVQLYSLRSEAEKVGVDAMLKKVSDLGYKQVELHTLYDMKAPAFKALLDKYGLEAPAAHRGFQQIVDDVQGSIRDAKALGLKLLIVPWLDITKYDTRKKWVEFSKALNQLGKQLKEKGIQLAYHNHDFEFKALKDGAVPYDVLLANTDPEWVALQLDLFWAVKAGQDVAEILNRNSGRVLSVHIKDMNKAGDMSDVGTGVIDFAAMLRVGVKNGLQYFIVEHDNPEDPFDSVNTSIQYLQKLKI